MFSDAPHYQPSTAHTKLGDAFADPVSPAVFPSHVLRFRNQPAAHSVGLDGLTAEEWTRHFGALHPLPGSLQVPLALRYHGHQFQHYNPDLGDGRGFLLAQLHERGTARLLDLGTKGSGTTPYSRGGDGRLTLQGGVREVLAAEQLQARGVPTCRILSLIETGESLYRYDEPSPTRSCVLVRLSHSHIRIGTFQRLAYHRQPESLERLVDHVLEHYYPQVSTGIDPASALLHRVVEQTALTAAAWMAAGFVHGVLNTDNINITGESFDYGPWRFAVDLDPTFTAAYFDEGGLYAYGKQSEAIHWNLKRLALALSLIADTEALGDAVARFPSTYMRALAGAWIRRMGLLEESELRDHSFVHRLTRTLADTRIPVDRFVYDWHGGPSATQRALSGPLGPLYRRRWFQPLRDALESRTPHPSAEAWVSAAPGPVSLDNDEVRALWSSIAEHDDWTPFEAKLRQVRARSLRPSPPHDP